MVDLDKFIKERKKKKQQEAEQGSSTPEDPISKRIRERKEQPVEEPQQSADQDLLSQLIAEKKQPPAEQPQETPPEDTRLTERKEEQKVVRLKVEQTEKPKKTTKIDADDLIRRYRRKQWYKQREKREDPKEMLTKTRPKLMKLSDAQAIDVAAAYKTFGIEIEPEKIIEISKEGYSPHVAKELGEDYLGNNLVIIAPEQRDQDLVRENHSYLNQILEKVFEIAEPIIQDFTPKEALVGGINNNIMKVVKNGERRFRVEVSLDTPTESVKRIRKVKKNIDTWVNAKAINIMKKKVRQKAEQLVRPLYDAYQNLGMIRTPDVFPIKLDMDLFVADLGSKQMYCFQNGKTLVIYFDNKNEIKPMETPRLRLVNGYDKEELLEAMYDANLIVFSKGTVRDYLVELAEQTFHKEGKDPEDFNTFVEYLKDTDAFEAENQSEEYKRVKQVLKELKKPGVVPGEHFKTLDPELRMRLVEPRTHHKLVYEILSRADPEDYFKAYQYHEDVFKEFFNRMTDEERESVLLSVMGKIHFADQYNRSVNTWIKEAYPELCEKVGVRFVEG